MVAMSRLSSSIDPEDFLEVGGIEKPHGVRGDVVVALTTTEKSRVAVDSVLYVNGEPFLITASRPHQHRWIVKFDVINDRSEAEKYARSLLFAPKMAYDEEELWVHELIGCDVVDQNGKVQGRVTAVQENPASDLLVLDSGALVPLVFVQSHEQSVIHVEVPEGLFELFDETTSGD